MAGVPVGDTTLLQRLKELHSAPKNRISQNLRYATVEQTDEYYAMHDAFPAVVTLIQAAQAVCDAGDKIVAPGDYWSERRADALSDLSAALAPFVGEATQ